MDPETFRRRLARLLNEYSKENESNTPDFILAEYLDHCLAAFDQTVNQRTKWFQEPTPVSRYVPPKGSRNASDPA